MISKKEQWPSGRAPDPIPKDIYFFVDICWEVSAI